MSSRAGRKRKAGIKRQPNGQPYREPENIKATCIDARVRQFGLSKELADTELAGYAIGRMALAGEFGADYTPAITAVYEYVTATADYMRIKWPMQSMPKAMDYMAGRGSSLAPEPSLKSVERIEKRFTDMQAKLAPLRSNYRMYFHEAAYHDRLGDDFAKEAVRVCIGRLMQ